MKKQDWLKVAVIVQAIGMAALAVVVIVHYFPYLAVSNKNSAANQMQSDKHTDDEAVAVIADKEISRQQLVEELLELYGDQTLEQMLVHEAISMAAEENGITLSAEELEQALAETIRGYENEEQYFEMMKTQLGLSQKRVISDIRDHALLIKLATRDIKVSEESIEAFLEQHRAELEPKQKLTLSWILSATYEDANNIVNELGQGADFAMLAQQYSLDPYSAEIGGSLGEVESDDPFYDAELLQEAAQMEIGSIAGPIKVENGYAVIQLLGRKTEGMKSEAQQREWARRQLALQQADSLMEVKQQLLNHYVTVIRK